MSGFKKLDDVLSVCGQISEADIVAAAGLGFKTLINNRPDNEALGQATSEEVAKWAKQLGLSYHHLPIPANDIPIDLVIELGEIYENGDKPILAFCTSGMRSSALWAFMMVIMSDGDIDDILAQPSAHGFDLSTLRDPMLSVRNAIAAQSAQ
ncbi:MAG: TIGR01244 family phosphatase [Sphingomonadales bacterium]|nr:TIGR01244 family phosphatase [Sphingomonadales bacterium]